MRCPECGGYRFDSDGRCLFCGQFTSSSPIPPTRRVPDNPAPSVDSGKGDAGKAIPASSNESARKPPVELYDCPSCNQMALFWNRYTQVYECLNPECKRKFTENEYKIKEVQVPLEEKPSEYKEQALQPTVRTKSQEPPHKEKPAKRGEYESIPNGGVYYCYKHNRYYRFECNLCRLEQIVAKEQSSDSQNGQVAQELQICPGCGQGMLRWNPANLMYECLNWRCRRRYTDDAFKYAKKDKRRRK